MRILRTNGYWIAIGVSVLLAALIYGNLTRDQSKTEGAVFRERVISEFRVKAANNFTMMIDLAPLCRAQFEGWPLAKVQEIFIAAGSKGLVDVSTLPESFRRVNDFDYMGGFDVGSTLIGNENFSMSFRVRRQNNILVVSKIIDCGVVSAYL